MIETIKAEKRMSGRSNRSNEKSVGSYWELIKLIFTAFYLDHSQNTFLTNFFTSTLRQNISNFKVALDIIQTILNKCEINAGNKYEDEISPIITPKDNSLVKMTSITSNTSIDVDTSNWDPDL